jgi:hypothetical protein
MIMIFMTIIRRVKIGVKTELVRSCWSETAADDLEVV